jgi:ribose transport system permease protein
MKLPTKLWSRRTLLESGAIVWLFVILIFVFALTQSEDFRTIANFSNLSRQVAVLGLVAIAQFLVVIAGGVDLSLGANVRVSTILAAMVMGGDNDRFILGIATSLGVGLFIGIVNAFIITRLQVEPFIATLGTGALLSGVALYLASTPVGRSAPLLDEIYGYSVGPFYLIFLFLVGIWILMTYATQRTVWGSHLYAVGGDAAIARLSGINVGKVTASSYVVSGLLGGLAGVVVLASSGIGDAGLVQGLEFDSLAVVVIGGASLAGGRGRLIGVLGGVLLFTLLGNVFNLLRFDGWYQQLIRGLVILIAAAALVDRHQKRRVRISKASTEKVSVQSERSP